MALLVPGSTTVVLVLTSPTSHSPPPDRIRIVHGSGSGIEVATPGLQAIRAAPDRVVYSTREELVCLALDGTELWRLPMALRDFEVGLSGDRLIGVRTSGGSVVTHVHLTTGAVAGDVPLPHALWQLSVATGGRYSAAATKTDLFLFDEGMLVRQVPTGLAYVTFSDVNHQGLLVFGGAQASGETLLGMLDSTGGLAWSLPGASDQRGYRPYVAFKPGSSDFVAVRLEGLTTYTVTGGF
jgi:hypothetical protein